jgi:tetratricopeptide (TPR) repeat protein
MQREVEMRPRSGGAGQARSGAAGGRPFVGRGRELEDLRAALDAAVVGRGALVLVTGEPGIGKTRLLEELSRHGEALAADILAGRCWEEGGAPAYWPWIQVVRAAGGEFERLAPHRPEGPAPDPDSERFELFDGVTRFLSERSRERPQLVLLDDLHAADTPSLLLLRFLSQSIAGVPMLVVASYRHGDVRARQLAGVLADLARAGHRIALSGLDLDDVAEYVGTVTGRPPSSPLVARLHHVTGGNPFFVSEVVQQLAAGPSDALDARLGDLLPRVPEEVRTLIRRRVAGLSPEALTVLRLAAVVGREFGVGTLGRTSRLTIARLLDALSEAVEAGLLVQDAENERRYAFVHELVRETLYADLPARRRMELHLTIGRALEDTHRSDLDPYLSEIARHFASAAPLADPQEAAEYLIRAGDGAASVLAYEEAALHYRRALELVDDEEDVAVAHRCELLLRLGDAQWRAGDTRSARVSFEGAAALARRLGAAELLGRAALGYVTGLGGFLLFGRFEVGGSGVELLEEALAALPVEDDELRALLLARLAVEMYSANEKVDRRLALSSEAIAMARRLGDSKALGTALHARQWALGTPDLVEERLATTDEMLSVAGETGDGELAFLAHNARFNCLLELGDGTGVAAEVRAMATIAERVRQPFYLWHVTCLHVVEATIAGRFAHADRLAAEALEIARLRHSLYADYMFTYAQSVAIRWAQGRIGELREVLAPHADLFPWVPRWRDALTAAEVGDEAAARAEIERHAVNGFADLPRDGLWLLHLCSLAEACVLVGDRERAAQIYELLLPFGDRHALSYTQQALGPVALRLGMLARLLGRFHEAERHYEAALDHCRSLGVRPAVARILADHAATLRTRDAPGDAARAEELLAEARTVCDELGLDLLRDRIDADAARESRAGSPSGAAVFRREGEFWTIAYDGTLLRLRDVKGLRYLAVLLAAPGREFHVLELASESQPERPAVDGASLEGLTARRPDSAGPPLDAQAKAAYRERLRELGEELQQARDWRDPERVAALEAEIDSVTGELVRAVGLGGRDRESASPAERARVSVTKAIRTAIRLIERESLPLGEHLDAAIRTGRFCSYAPRGETAPDWTL